MTSTILDPTRVPIGLDRNRDIVSLRFTEIENPHILIVGGSQVGKTTLQILIAAVAASRGNIVLILDPKLRFSRAFRHPITREPLPNVLVYRDPDPDVAAAEWDAILALVSAEMQRRYELDDNSDVSILADQTRFPTILVVVDELGNLLDFADKEWPYRKPEEYKGDTPVREYLHSMTRMGAEARVIGCFANQTASEREMPAGTRTRNLCGQRLFLGPVREGPQWRMLAGEGVERPDIPDGQKGAGAIIFGDAKPWRFQAGFLDWKNHPEHVYDLAVRGVPILQEHGHIDDHGRLLLGGTPVPRPGRIAGQVASGGFGTGNMPPAATSTPKPTPEPDASGPTPAADAPAAGSAEDQAVAEAPVAELDPEHAVVGLADGAKFCKMSYSNFRKWRELYPIPNEVSNYQGNKPAWHKADLREWTIRRADDRRGNRKKEGA
jgi:hypothetical protein